MPFCQEIAFLSIISTAVRVKLRRWAGLDPTTKLVLTSEEVLHVFAVGHLQEAAARISRQGGVGAIGEQDSHHIKVIVLHGIVNGSTNTNIQ